jgi:preprotein translocase subunit SecD
MNFRLIIFIVAIIFGVVASLPSFLQTEKGAKINLGLDLQGGLHMLLGVQTDKAIESKYKSLASSIKYFCDDKEIIIDDLSIADDHISFALLDKDEAPKLDKMLSEDKGLKVDKDGLNYTITFTPKEQESIKKYAIKQAIDTIRNRLDQFGLSEPTVARQGKSNILVELPGIKTVEEERRARELIAKAAHLLLMAVDEDSACH